jgi:cyclic-di-AMP phosphodiesterase PgpH
MNPSLRSFLRYLPETGKYALVLLTVLFIAFLFPDSVRFGYSYQNGAAWNYPDLYAPFDFPIQKSKSELDAESHRIKEEIPPCYTLNPEVARQQKRVFEEAFRTQLANYQNDEHFADVARNPKQYLDYGLGLLDRLFTAGIIDLAPQHASAGGGLVVAVVRGNTTRRQTVQSLFTPEKAVSLITDSLPYSRLAVAEFFLPILPDAIIPNLIYDDSLTRRFQAEQLSGLAEYRGIVAKNELIVAEGQVITPEIYQKLKSFEAAHQDQIRGGRSIWLTLAGYILLTALIIGILIVYLNVYAKPMFANFSWLVFILIWFLGFSYLVFAVKQTEVVSLYIIPFCIAPIVIKILHSDRLAIFTHLVVVLIATFLSSMGFEFALLQVLAGIVAVMSNPDGRDWGKLFRSLIFIYLTYALGYVAIALVEKGAIGAQDRFFFAWIFLNVFLTMLAYPLVPLLERIFGFTSPVSLMELSDLNRPLLRELAEKAPGTLQHSLQVGHLAEAAANAIGADSLLIKVGALYHDIGKTVNPEYFIENQTQGNPHEDQDYLESARIIIRHVTEGAQMAKKAGLPEMVSDFITTHHGTTRVEFFFRHYLREDPSGKDIESEFRYPGPLPVTREQTILMLADSLEASSKSLKNPTGKDIDELVDKIIDGKISMGQLAQAQLSFGELESCRAVFKARLRSINHVRIEYPEPPPASS